MVKVTRELRVTRLTEAAVYTRECDRSWAMAMGSSALPAWVDMLPSNTWVGQQLFVGQVSSADPGNRVGECLVKTNRAQMRFWATIPWG